MKRSALALALLLSLHCGGEEERSPVAEPAAAPAQPEVPPSQVPPQRVWIPAGTYTLRFEASALSVEAFDAPRRPLLEELAQKAGFVLEAAPGDWPALTLRLEAQPLELALPLLVGEFEYRAEWSNEDGAHRLAKLVVGAPRTSANLPEGALRPGEIGDALERALKEHGDASESLSEEDALAQLKDADPEQRVRAALALEAEGAGLTALMNALEHDPDPRVRAATTVSLEESEDFAAVQALVSALDDPEPEVVIEVLDSLEFAGDESTVIYVQPLLSHPDPRVRQAAGNALRLLGE
ncbi:MAG: HEAT repeat domain-containing protein [Deltaproteobacteria bacterium]|nr:HEAT repeat domain-containing protein [Deltaproteobacteria bacterium]